MRARFNYIGAAAHRPIYNSSKLLLLLMRTWLRVQLPLICNVTVISTFPYVPVADTVCRDGVRVLTKCKRVLSVRGFHLPPPPPPSKQKTKRMEPNTCQPEPGNCRSSHIPCGVLHFQFLSLVVYFLFVVVEGAGHSFFFLPNPLQT